MSTPPGSQPPGPYSNPYGGQPPGYGQQGAQPPYGQPAGYGGQQPHPGQQPYPGQSPYGQPYGAYSSQYGGGGGRGRSPVPWIVGGLVVVVAGVGAALFFVLGGESKDDTSSPQATVESLAAAIEDGDADAISNLLCEGDRAAGQDDAIAANVGDGGQLEDYEITGEEKDGDITYVIIEEESGTTRIPVVEENGEYLVCATAVAEQAAGLGNGG